MFEGDTILKASKAAAGATDWECEGVLTAVNQIP